MNSPEPKLEYSRGEQRAWYMYDFANSAFASTVVTLFLGPYLTELAKAAADAGGNVHPLGLTVDARSYWSYLISLSVLTQVVFLPMLGQLRTTARTRNGCSASSPTWARPARLRCLP